MRVRKKGGISLFPPPTQTFQHLLIVVLPPNRRAHRHPSQPIRRKNVCLTEDFFFWLSVCAFLLDGEKKERNKCAAVKQQFDDVSNSSKPNSAE
jgi:hypothetical protein